MNSETQLVFCNLSSVERILIEKLSCSSWEALYLIDAKKSFNTDSRFNHQAAALVIDIGELILIESKELSIFENIDIFRLHFSSVESLADLLKRYHYFDKRNVLEFCKNDIGKKGDVMLMWSSEEISEPLVHDVTVGPVRIRIPIGLVFSFDKKTCLAKLDELPTCCRFIENFSRDDISACSGDILFDFELIN